MYRYPDKKTAQIIRKRLISWGKKNFAKFPWRHTRNLFHALTVEILLQRTKAEQVLPVYKAFIKKFRSPKVLANARPSEIRKTIKSLGLLWRAPLLKEMGAVITRAYKGKVPCAYEVLINLPGVGPYAASAFISFHCDSHRSIVDSNVVRLYGRLFGFETGPETRRNKQMLELAKKMTPLKKHKEYNYALLDFTRAVCSPNPKCHICCLRQCCGYIIKKERGGG
ncbi:MAG: hypothetical protein ABIA67_01910 [Candidatus Margulisiibacteriota bacterium]